MKEPAQGSIIYTTFESIIINIQIIRWKFKKKDRTFGMPVSSCKIICVFRAILDENLEGRASASSKEFVCRDWVPPKTAAMASTVVRMMLLYGSWAVSDHPDVWQCVLKANDLGLLGLKCSWSKWAQRRRAALSFAISCSTVCELRNVES